MENSALRMENGEWRMENGASQILDFSVVFLGLGSNLGDRQENIWKALALIDERVGEVQAVSTVYESHAWGYDSENTYLNTALAIKTYLQPEALLIVTQEIEKEIGRKSKTTEGKYQDREIDIDILLYDDIVIISDTLNLPHPQLHLRPFVLKPMVEIAPFIIHPVLMKTITELYQRVILSNKQQFAVFG